MSLHSLKCTLTVGLLAFLTGCGGSAQRTGPELVGSIVTGKLLQGGKPIKLLKDETIRISIVEAAEGKNTGGSDVKEDGSFEIKGPSDKGMPAGKYKVVITSEIYGGGGNRFAEKFDAEVTMLYADVSGSGTDNIEVDIGTRKVTKK
jgi:hypothetical protein